MQQTLKAFENFKYTLEVGSVVFFFKSRKCLKWCKRNYALHWWRTLRKGCKGRWEKLSGKVNCKIRTPVIHTLKYTTCPLSAHNHSWSHNLFSMKLNPVNVFLSYTHVGASLYLHSLSYSLCLFAFLGGGYLSGAGAQDENLYRRTDYVQHLADPEKNLIPQESGNSELQSFHASTRKMCSS